MKVKARGIKKKKTLLKKLGSREYLVQSQTFFEVKVSVWLAEIKSVGRKLGLTCVPDILDPYVGAGSEKQPLDGDEEEADDV